MCERPFDASTLDALALVTSFALIASEQLAEVHAACREGLVDLGGVAVDPMKPCDDLVTTIGDARLRLTVTMEKAECAAFDPPTCAAPNTARKPCSGGALVATVPEDASDRERAVATMITRRYGAVARTKPVLSRLSDLAARFSGTISARSIASECEGTVERFAAQAARDTQELARVTTLVAGI